jgi:threonine dehydrogenase-like Zn-dependent dehydrogenase
VVVVRAVVIQEPGTIEVTEVPDPVPGPKDVVARVAGCGICGTDLHILDGEFAPTLPVIPGHEFAGDVVAAGPEVPADRVEVGDQVAVDPSLHCGECYYCRRGRGNLCENWAAIGVSTAGGAAEYAVAPFAEKAEARFSPYRVYNKEITIVGSMALLHSFERAGDLFVGGALKPDVMISDRFPLADYPKAIEQFANGVGRKIQVNP